MIENNVEYRVEQNQLVEEKHDRLISLSEKNLQIVVDGTRYGYNPPNTGHGGFEDKIIIQFHFCDLVSKFGS